MSKSKKRNTALAFRLIESDLLSNGFIFLLQMHRAKNTINPMSVMTTIRITHDMVRPMRPGKMLTISLNRLK